MDEVESGEEWFVVRVVDVIFSGSDPVTCLKELKGKIHKLDKERRLVECG